MNDIFFKMRGEIFKWCFFILDFIVPKEKNLFLFGAGSGNSYTNNSRYLFEYTKENEPKIQAVWICKNEEISNFLNKKYGKRSAFCKGDRGIIWLLLRARVVYITHGSKDMVYRMFKPSSRKTVIQLWHGIGTKAVGFMDPMSDKQQLAVENNKFDFIISNSYIDSMFSNRIFKLPIEKIWPCGCPKLDGVRPREDKKIKTVLYAATYGSDNLFPFEVDLSDFDKFLSEVGLTLVISAHRNDYMNHGPKGVACDLKNIEFIDQGPLYDILNNINSTDILITDYSSIFWDFVWADKPTIFVASIDGEREIRKKIVMDYKVMHGGVLCHNYDELKNQLREIENLDLRDRERRDLLRRLFFEREINGVPASRVIIDKTKKEIGLDV